MLALGQLDLILGIGPFKKEHSLMLNIIVDIEHIGRTNWFAVVTAVVLFVSLLSTLPRAACLFDGRGVKRVRVSLDMAVCVLALLVKLPKYPWVMVFASLGCLLGWLVTPNDLGEQVRACDPCWRRRAVLRARVCASCLV